MGLGGEGAADGPCSRPVLRMVPDGKQVRPKREETFDRGTLFAKAASKSARDSQIVSIGPVESGNREEYCGFPVGVEYITVL